MVTIVTDSSCCIKTGEAEKLGVRLVPMDYTVDGRRYIEDFGDRNGDFEELLRGPGVFTTSHPSPGAYLSCFAEELAKGNDVLCLTISSRLSGSYSSAYIAARQTANSRVFVVDSYLTAGGLLLLAQEARRLLDSGLGAAEAARELISLRDSITITFSVDDMAPLLRSGRIGFVRRSVGTMLNLRPILLCRDGVIVSDGTARGRAEMLRRLAQRADCTVKRAVVCYIGDRHAATTLYCLLRAKWPELPVALRRMGPVLGIHLGPGVVGVALQS